MIANLDPEVLAQREVAMRAEKANMAIKFCLALCGRQGNQQTPEQMTEFALTLAERLHGFVTGPQPETRIVS